MDIIGGLSTDFFIGNVLSVNHGITISVTFESFVK
jgi:hypothetical protein